MAGNRFRYGAWRRRARPARPAVRRAGRRRRGRRAGARRRQPARRPARPAPPRPARRPRPRRPARPRPPDAPGGAAPRQPRRRGHPGPARCSTRPWPPNATSCAAATTTTPGSPRRCSTTCPAPPRTPSQELSGLRLGQRRGPGDVPADPRRAAPRGGRAALRRAEGRAAGPRPGRRRPRLAEMVADLNDLLGQARPRRGHRRRVRRVHGQARRVLPGAAAATSTS